MMNPKLLFRNALRTRNTGRPPFVPMVYSLAAKLAQVPLETICHDATCLTNSLVAAHKLFGYDGIVNTFDSTLEAEALGCVVQWRGDYELPLIAGTPGLIESVPADLARSERLSALLEVTRRLVMSEGKGTAIVGAVTGPLSLARYLVNSSSQSSGSEEFAATVQRTLSATSDLLSKLTTRLCQSRVDAVFIREEQAGASFSAKAKAFSEVYATLFNIISYYDSSPVLVLESVALQDIPVLFDTLKPAGVIINGQTYDLDKLSELQKLSESLGICFGLALDTRDQDELWEQLELIGDFVNCNRPKGFFYTSDGEIPYDTPVEILQRIMEKLAKVILN